MKNNKMRSVAAAAAIASVSAVALASLGAGNAAAGKLPGGFITQTLVDGTKVSVQLKNEFVSYPRSTVALPTSRNVAVSGQVIVNVAGGAKGGNIAAGYVVGCQLNFGAGANGGAGDSVDSAGTVTPSAEADANNASFTLGPGEATYVPIIQDTADDLDTTNPDYNINDFDFSGARGGIAYSQEQFKIDGCAGFAQAKAKITVNVSTDSVDGYVTLFGKPFTLG